MAAQLGNFGGWSDAVVFNGVTWLGRRWTSTSGAEGTPVLFRADYATQTPAGVIGSLAVMLCDLCGAYQADFDSAASAIDRFEVLGGTLWASGWRYHPGAGGSGYAPALWRYVGGAWQLVAEGAVSSLEPTKALQLTSLDWGLVVAGWAGGISVAQGSGLNVQAQVSGGAGRVGGQALVFSNGAGPNGPALQVFVSGGDGAWVAAVSSAQALMPAGCLPEKFEGALWVLRGTTEDEGLARYVAADDWTDMAAWVLPAWTDNYPGASVTPDQLPRYVLLSHCGDALLLFGSHYAETGKAGILENGFLQLERDFPRYALTGHGGADCSGLATDWRGGSPLAAWSPVVYHLMAGLQVFCLTSEWQALAAQNPDITALTSEWADGSEAQSPELLTCTTEWADGTEGEAPDILTLTTEWETDWLTIMPEVLSLVSEWADGTEADAPEVDTLTSEWSGSRAPNEGDLILTFTDSDVRPTTRVRLTTGGKLADEMGVRVLVRDEAGAGDTTDWPGYAEGALNKETVLPHPTQEVRVALIAPAGTAPLPVEAAFLRFEDDQVNLGD